MEEEYLGVEVVDEEQGIGAWIWLIPILGILTFLFTLRLYISQDFYAQYSMGISLQTWKSLTAGAMILYIIVLMLVYISKRPTEGEEEEQVEALPVAAEEKSGAVVVEDITEEEEETIEYPPKITGAIYGDALIDIGNKKKLLLRTLLARLCIVCDNQDACWEQVKDTISREEFYDNVECKFGLKKLAAKKSGS